MANEFKIKNGLQILNTHPIYGISDSSLFNRDSSLLATINAVQSYIVYYFLNWNFMKNTVFVDAKLSSK